MRQPTGDELRDMIDGALEEIELTELEMLDLLAEMLGPERAQQVADYIAAREAAEAAELRREASPGSSRSRPVTR